MRYLLDLRVRLQQRRNRVHMVDYRHYETELQLFLQFLDDNPYLRALLHTLDAGDEADFGEWKDAAAKSRSIAFPPSETARAKLCLGILKECAYDPEQRAAISWGSAFSHESRFNEMLNDLNEAVLDPVVNYLDDRIDDTGNVVYLLQRFKRKAEWFSQQELHQAYLRDTGSGEKNLDRRLREALFDGGVDFPFSQPDSPSGRAECRQPRRRGRSAGPRSQGLRPGSGQGQEPPASRVPPSSALRQRLPAEHRLSRRVQLFEQSVGLAVRRLTRRRIPAQNHARRQDILLGHDRYRNGPTTRKQGNTIGPDRDHTSRTDWLEMVGAVKHPPAVPPGPERSDSPEWTSMCPHPT